ncbi:MULTISPECIES: TetR/AcrR family transcriptional regulator [Spirosoma]|uniref:TetR/AcrR family transcriptional regulator n=1 Tax=Spirosoma liriopis TaxID=2937440 RepID=A0ABT0HLR4_9BACT|nr:MULTISPECIES: TetR/AcrR family transcriptional regulator [Spirosoma]MCK8492593.1 TetR/AcrR family transcriptional regulator [Spirosoma liriopis]UHG93630.1 TetR/AcrR family transcriptional regulator [Spirosoma oryzicola]
MTMERILRAMGDVMAERGTEKAGINAVAEKAGVNKVLIYRYFGGWNGLLEAYVQRGFFLSMFNEKFMESVPEKLPAETRSKIWSEYTIQFMREFRTRKPSQELIRWEMSNGETELARRLAEFRDNSYKKLVDRLAPYSDYDPIAITSLMVAAVTNIVLTSTQRDHIVDIDLTSDAGWERLETAVRRIYSSLSIALELEETKKVEAK